MTTVNITGGWTSEIDWPSIPADIAGSARNLMAQSDALVDAGDLGGGLAAQDQAKALLQPYKKKKGPPPPTAANPAPPEGIPDNSEAIAVSTAPDVCKTPRGSSTPPIPYCVYGLAGDDGNYSPDVFYNGYRAMRYDSLFTKTYGDEPGTALGVKSGTVGDIVEPTSHSPIVRINGSPAIRHRDKNTLNSGNNPGEFVFHKSSETKKAPDGTDELQKQRESSGQAKPEGKGAWDSFADQFMDKSGTAQDVVGAWDKAGQYWNDPGSALSDAQSVWNDLPSGEDLWRGTQAAWDAATWENVSELPGVAWDQGVATVDATKQIYSDGGLPALAGAGLGIAGEFINPFKKLKMLKEGAEVLDELGDAAKIGRKLEEKVPEKKLAEKLEPENENGDPGLRVTRPKYKVKCFDKKGKFKDPKNTAEYDRQLKMQQDALNRMSPDDYLNARKAFDPANRMPEVQQRVRDRWKLDRTLELSRGGLDRTAAAARAKSEASSLAALHELDMIAGGDPAKVLGMGDKRINSSAGASWRSRVGDLDKEAQAAKAAGQKTMNVELKRC